MSYLPPLLTGIAFGWMLQKAKLGRYETIVNVFRFTDLTVVKFLLSALVVGMITVRALVSLGLAADVPVPQTYVLGNLGGGLLFGVGMALAGFCPGTVAAGAGEGRLDTLVAGSLGLYAGAVLFGLGYARFFPAIAGVLREGSVTMTQTFHVEGWLVIVLFTEVALLLFYALERARRAKIAKMAT